MKTSPTMLLSRRAVLLGLAAIAITVSPLAAQAQCPSPAALVLNQPGNYVLTGDINCFAGGLGVLISSSNVSLNLAGHNLAAYF